jgi:trimethylamine-N-oxide reductase (cytochrome c)
LQKTVEDSKSTVSRRDFVKITAAFAGAVAVVSTVPFGTKLLKPVSAEEADQLQAASNQVTTSVVGLAFDGVGMGGNLAQVYSQNGRIIRITPLDYTSKQTINPWSITATRNGTTMTFNSHPTSTLLPPFSIAYKKRAISPNRVMYPLKRVDWNPGGGNTSNYNPQNRGVSKYVRISWDDATTYIANELNRTIATYGSTAVMFDNGPHGETKLINAAHGCVGNLMNYLGHGTMLSGSADSWEGWYWGAKHAWGMTRWCGLQALQTNVIPDTLQNTDLILFWGCDPESHSWGWGGQALSNVCFWFKDAGIRSIYVDPVFNAGAAVHADKWIPILPNTDIAMHLAIAYTWITEETYDKDYVSTHTVGFDESSLPSGAPAGSSFKAYVLGQTDGIPKTPKWAEEICSVPSRTIKALARDWASNITSTAHCNGGAMIRGPYTHENARTEVYLLAMQGIGNPGINQLKLIEALQDSLPAPKFKPSVASMYPGNTIIPHGGFPANFWLQAVNASHSSPVLWYGPGAGPWSPVSDQFKQLMYPAPPNSEVHMFWSDEACKITCETPGNDIATAYTNPKLETFVLQTPWFENDCMYADLVLPVKTIFEIDEDIMTSAEEGKAEYTSIYYMQNCMTPVGESLSDWEIVCQVALKYDTLFPPATGSPTLYQQYTGQPNSSTPSEIIDSLVEAGFNYAMGSHTDVDFPTLKQNGYYVIDTDPNWNNPTDYPTGISAFAADPTSPANSLETKSGLIEFFSGWLFDHFPNDTERPPRAHYIANGPTHSESLSSPRAKQYPLLFVSDHPRWRVHAEMDDISWLREIPTMKVTGSDGLKYEPVWINTVDAADRGIVTGDIVQVFNERGVVLGGAYVTERVIQGALEMFHGARLDPINPAPSSSPVIDRGGSNNAIAPGHGLSANAPGTCCSGFLVQLQKADMASLEAQYPTPFTRTYDEETGSDYDWWVNSTAPSGGS